MFSFLFIWKIHYQEDCVEERRGLSEDRAGIKIAVESMLYLLAVTEFLPKSIQQNSPLNSMNALPRSSPHSTWTKSSLFFDLQQHNSRTGWYNQWYFSSDFCPFDRFAQLVFKIFEARNFSFAYWSEYSHSINIIKLNCSEFMKLEHSQLTIMFLLSGLFTFKIQSTLWNQHIFSHEKYWYS